MNDMQAGHFKLIAETIARVKLPVRTRQHLAESFADALAPTNKHFDREHFVRAATGQAPLQRPRPRR